MCLHVQLCTKRTLNGGFCACLCGMENRVTLYNVVDIFKFSCTSLPRRKTFTTRVVWKKLLSKSLSYDADKKLVGTPHLFWVST